MNLPNEHSASTGDIPVLHCRGTHYDVGFRIGLTFKTMIQDLLETWKYFNDVVVRLGSTDEGKALTQNSLKLCTRNYPDYINEIKGMANGAGIEFDKLFMLNIDSILCTLEENENDEVEKLGGSGCTTILCNKDEIILGHTEDAMAEIKDHVYIVSVEILSDSDENVVLEKFTTLCYAGTLMGYTMGFNSHGMIYSVNTIFPIVYTNGTREFPFLLCYYSCVNPNTLAARSFIARSLLGTPDLPSLLNILRDKGNGISDGFSLNVYFCLKCNDKRDNGSSNAPFYNIEVAPPNSLERRESIVDVHVVEPGSIYTHCNRYCRIKTNECNPTAILYSDKRNCVLSSCTHSELESEHCVRKALSDQSDFHYPIYNDGKIGEMYAMNFIRTVAVGIFNINQKTWSVYSRAPVAGNPVHTFSLE